MVVFLHHGLVHGAQVLRYLLLEQGISKSIDVLVVTLGIGRSLLDHGLEGPPLAEDPNVLHVGSPVVVSDEFVECGHQ